MPLRRAGLPGSAVNAPVDYRYFGTFDHRIFAEQFRRAFSGRKMAAGVEGSLLALLTLIERDPKIWDLRWMAYMLATVLKETTTLTSSEVRVLDKKGKPVLDKDGHPRVRKVRHWVTTMAPVPEVGHGAGRRYHEPVKVARLPDGSARVTEQDGDQWTVKANGVLKPARKGVKLGTTDGGAAVKAYDDDAGTPHAYFGRGYVQLTWWSNYASTGVAIGHGLDLLFDPDLVYQPGIAYAIMSHGMLTGDGFANGRKFSDYFAGSRTDYVGARAMVNGTDCNEEIAGMARSFEKALTAARRTPREAAR